MEFSDLKIRIDPGKVHSSTICPECNDERQRHKNQHCLTYHNEQDNRFFKCHHCGWSGNLEIMGKYDQVRKAANMPSHIGPERTFSAPFTKYLFSRGFTVKTLTRLSIYETERSLIGFPFYQGYTLVNVKFLNMNPKPGKPKWFQLPQSNGTKVCFMGLQDLDIDREDPGRRRKNEVTIAEGEWDWLTWKECGYQNALSVPMGAPSATAKNFHKEFQYIHDDGYFKGMAKYVDTFYIAVDDDPAGVVLKENLVKILGPHRCKIVTYPPGYKDINEVLMGNKEKDLPALGKDKVKELHKIAKNYPLRGLITAQQLVDDLTLFRTGGMKPGFGIGIPEIDHLFTVKRQHISFWTGIPGMGKSVCLRWYISQLMKNNPEENFKFAMFVPEDRPTARVVVKLAEVFTGKLFEEGQPNSMTTEEREMVLKFINQHFFIISPDRFNFESFSGSIRKDSVNSVQAIFEYISHLAKTENIFGYVIDAFNKLEFDYPSHKTETKYISEILDFMIDFNTAHKVHGFIVAHPTKTNKDNNGNYTMPSLYDIAGSRAWYEKCDIGVVLHRYKYMTDEEAKEQNDDLKYKAKTYTPLYMKTEKIRFEELGHIGIMRLDIDKYSRFSIHPDDKDKHLEYTTETVSMDEQQPLKLWDLDEDDPLRPRDTEDLPF